MLTFLLNKFLLNKLPLRKIEIRYVYPNFYFDNYKYDWHSGIAQVAAFDEILQQLKKEKVVVYDNNSRCYVINRKQMYAMEQLTKIKE